MAGSRTCGPGTSKPAMLTNSVARGAVVDHRHVAPGTVDVGPGPGGGQLAVGIEHEQAAIAPGSRGAVAARRAADDHPAAFQHGHRGGQPDAARALRQMPRQLGEQRRLLGRRVVVDDRGAEALQVRNVVEIVDQHIVFLNLPGRHRRHHDGIGILVAVVRHGRGQRDVLLDGLQEAARLIGPRRRGAAARQTEDQRRPARSATRMLFMLGIRGDASLTRLDAN